MCATTKYVSDTWMTTGMTASMIPLIPPSVNIVMKPSANSIGVVRWIAPLHSVASQENQKTCWYMSTSPPPAGSKKWVPSERSSSTKNCEPAMNGVAMTTSSDVVKLAHTSSGMRQNVMPGARIVMRKFSAVAIDEAPANCTPIVKNCWPTGVSVEIGAYAVQPVANAPPST